MDLGLQFEELKCYSCVLDTVTRREETQEAIVSDALPDIGTIISATATAFLHHCRADNGAVAGEGEIAATVIYEPEEGGTVCAIPVRIPFRCGAESNQVNPDCRVNVVTALHGVDVKAMNPRKIMVQAEVSLHFMAFSEQVRRFSVGVADGAGEIQTKQERLQLQFVSQVTEKSFPFEDSVTLSGAHRGMERVLGCDYVPYCNESKLVGSKVVFKGGVKLCVKFLSEEGALLRETYDLPVSQVLDAGASGESASASVSLSVTDAQLQLTDRDSLEVSMELYASAMVLDHRETSVLTDAYSTRCRCRCGTQAVHTLNMKEHNTIVHPFRQALDVELPTAEVLMESAWLAEVLGNADDGLRCRLKVSCCLKERDGRLMKVDQSCYVELPVSKAVSARSLQEVRLLEAVCVSAAGGMEVRGNLLIRYAAISMVEVHCLEQITLEDGETECDSKPSAVLRRLRPGETLWDLGKEYFATVDDILTVNQITDENAADGRFLLIPRNR